MTAIYSLNVILLFATTGCVCDSQTTASELLSVVVIYRHGDRTPVQPYPNDPYRNASYWPVGFGQLTNLGKQHQFKLGRWLRERYNTFLPVEYSEKDIYIRSTDVDRTLMSAEVNTAGLYPPEGQQIWDEHLKWQPVPIHTEPVTDDNILAMEKPCPMYDVLYDEVMNSGPMRELNLQLADMYDYLTRYSGETIDSITQIEYFYNTLFIESLNNYTLPDWAKPFYPDKLEPYACLSFAMQCNNTRLARLKTGPFFHLLLNHFKTIETNASAPKFWVFSAHDTTVANVLNAMGAFDIQCPPYMSTVIFELRKSSETNTTFVNIFYKNSTDPLEVSLDGCEFDCPLDVFEDLLAPITVSGDQWESECRRYSRRSFYYGGFVGHVEDTAFFAVLGVGFCVLLTLGAVMVYKHRRRQKVMYLRVPNADTLG